MGMFGKSALALAWLHALPLFGCSEGAVMVAGIVEYVDQGELCMFADEPSGPISGEQSFDVGARLVVTVAMPECLSSSCDVNRVAECQIGQQGRSLSVTSYLSYEPKDQAQCTMDCGRLVATCTSDPLGEGTYEIAFDGTTHLLTVPSLMPSPCR